MIYSMTGFGRSEGSAGGRPVTVEIRSLNGKQLELSSRVPALLRPWELELRNLVGSKLLRGSVDINITVKQDGANKPMMVNLELAEYYHQAMQQVVSSLRLAETPSLDTLMRMPEVVSPATEIMPEAEWKEVATIAAAAASKLMEHRRVEGSSILNDVLGRFTRIESLLTQIEPLEAERKERVYAKVQNAMREMKVENMDANRFEQEMIYYLEKQDFSEEKVRLKQHCEYFRSTVADQEIAKGKLLGFIVQEVGREINTLGSKANDAAIQRLVVQMKDELEKAKEQILNIL